MKIQCCKRNGIFIPAFDTDYEKMKSLKEGVYNVSVSNARNVEFNAKYHKLIDTAWNALTEEQTKFFGTRGKEAFRKSMEITAGYYEPLFDFCSKEWHRAPISTAFDAMDESEFRELYDGVYDSIRALLTNKSMTQEMFDTIFEGY